jgi:hypothetical protein
VCASPSTRSSSLRGALLAGACLAFGSHASALTLDDVTPLYFDVVPYGFSPAAVAAAGRSPDALTTSSDLFLGAGTPASGAPVQVSSQVISAVHQLPPSPTPADPAIIDSSWTIANVSAGALSAPLLLFTALDPLDTYPGDPVIGLDAGLLRLVAYSFGASFGASSGGPEIVYGAVSLPDLAQGESTQITVRYVIASPLQVQDATQLIAPLGLAVALTYTELPEPSTLLLAVGGLFLTALCGRSQPGPGGELTRRVRCSEPRELRPS